MRFDHALGVAEVLAGAPADVGSLLASAPATARERPPVRTDRPSIVRSPSQDVYEENVRRAQQHIRDGDAFQIVVSQRADRATSATAVDLYRALGGGWVEHTGEIFTTHAGVLAQFGLSREECGAMIIKARIKAGWIEEPAGPSEK